MKLKTYLNLDMHMRAKWAFFADLIFANYRVKNSPMRPDAVYIPFLQHWLPTTRHQPDRTPLNTSLKTMVKAATKYCVELEPPSYAGLVEMPIWHHYGQDVNKRQVNNAPTHRCLREVHKVLQVGEALDVTTRLVRCDHEASPGCACEPCAKDRSAGCKDPHACATAVLGRLNALTKKWDPRHASESDDGLGPGVNEDEVDQIATYRRPPPPKQLTGSARVFTAHDQSLWSRGRKTRPTPCPLPRYPPLLWLSILNVASRMIVWAIRCLRIWTDDSTDTTAAKYLAAIYCTQLVHPDTPIAIFTKKGTLLREVKNTAKNEMVGWIGMRYKDERKALAANLRKRTARTTFHHLVNPTMAEKGLSREAELIVNEYSRRSLRSTDVVDLAIPQGWLPRGARLSHMTQSLATTAIRKLEEVHIRPATVAQMKEAQDHMFAMTQKRPPVESIWRSLRSRDIGSRARNFFWKLGHNAFRVGRYWTHIPECGERATCRTCHVEESMDHILFQCERTGQTESWALAETLWLGGHGNWQPPSMGGVLSCAMAEVDDVGESSAALGRLLDPKLVTARWSGILMNEQDLSANWVRGPAVIVGIEPYGSSRSPPLP
ncbi:hypothetical protein C8F01DRAFT_1081445 [Mycena amicta]|nr:hypothetical protein C8F01DRAFT_1081445 [Mycena amicta]